jgi:hypothetical protein
LRGVVRPVEPVNDVLYSGLGDVEGFEAVFGALGVANVVVHGVREEEDGGSGNEQENDDEEEDGALLPSPG